MTTSYQDVENYLRELKVLIKLFDKVYFVSRDTIGGIRDLGLTEIIAKEIIYELEVPDYVDGPLQDHFYKNFYVWIFGKFSPISNEEIYIKMTERKENEIPVCISFHKAKSPLTYPFKNFNSQNNNPLRN